MKRNRRIERVITDIQKNVYMEINVNAIKVINKEDQMRIVIELKIRRNKNK